MKIFSRIHLATKKAKNSKFYAIFEKHSPSAENPLKKKET
jgi:hypothetical protein